MTTHKATRACLFRAACMLSSLMSFSIVRAVDPVQSTVEPAKETDTKADAILEKSARVYRDARSYQDRVEFTVNFKVKSEDDDEDVPGGREKTQSGTTCFESPNKLAIKFDDYSVHSDGEKFWAHFSEREQYIEKNVSDFKAVRKNFLKLNYIQGSMHPVIRLLLDPDKKVRELFPITRISEIKHDTLEGTSCHLLRGKLEMPVPGSDDTVDLYIWIEESSGLLRQIRVDMIEAYKKLSDEQDNGGDADADTSKVEEDDEEDAVPRPPRYEKAEMLVKFSDIKLNAAIPQSSFVFKPGPDDEKVGSLMGGMSRSRQMALVSNPAPEYEAEDFDGKKLNLAQFRDRVVVMDFWATWCGPCVQAIPHVQELSEKFKDQPVTVLGINRDQDGSEKKVLKFLDKKKITFRQVKDFEGDIAKKYKVSGIPCLVLIDKNGKVQEIQTGFSPGTEDELAAKIEKLLKGQDIFDPAEIAEARKELEEQDKELAASDDEDEDDEDAIASSKSPTNDDAKTSTALAEVATERLVKNASKISGLSWYGSKKVDLDGDGDFELVVPNQMRSGGLSIFSAGSAKPRKLKLQGAAGEQITCLEPVKVNGNWHWLVGHTNFGGMDGSQKVAIAFYDQDGKQLWKYKPDLPKKVSAQMQAAAGDLDGDGSCEAVIGLTTHEMRRRGASFRGDSQKSYVIILSDKGEPICIKKIKSGLSSVAIIEGEKKSPPKIVVGGWNQTSFFQLASSSLTAKGESESTSEKND